MPLATLSTSAPGGPNAGGSVDALGDSDSPVSAVPAQRMTADASNPAASASEFASEPSAELEHPADAPGFEDAPQRGAGYTPRGETVAGALGRGLLASLRSASLAGNRWTFRTVSMNSLSNARVRGEGSGLAEGLPASVPPQRLAAPIRPTSPAPAPPSTGTAATPGSITAARTSSPTANTPSPASTRAGRSRAVAHSGPAQRIAGEIGRRASIDASAPRAVYGPLAAHVRTRTRLAGSMDITAAPPRTLPRASASPVAPERTPGVGTSASAPGSQGIRGVTAQRRSAVQRRAVLGTTSPMAGALGEGTRATPLSSSGWDSVAGRSGLGLGGQATSGASLAPGALASRSLGLAHRIATRSSADIVSLGGTNPAPVVASAEATRSPSRMSAPSTGMPSGSTAASGGAPAQRKAIGRRPPTRSRIEAAVPVRRAPNLGLTRAIEGGSVLAGHAAARFAPDEASPAGVGARAVRAASALDAVQRLARPASRNAAADGAQSTVTAPNAQPSAPERTPGSAPAAGTGARSPIDAPTAQRTPEPGAATTGATPPTTTPTTTEMPSAFPERDQRALAPETRGIEAPSSLIPRDAATLPRALGEPTLYEPDAIAGAPVRGAGASTSSTSASSAAPAVRSAAAASALPAAARTSAVAQRRAAQDPTTNDSNDERQAGQRVEFSTPRSRGAYSVLALPHAIDTARPLTAQAARFAIRSAGARAASGAAMSPAQRLARSSEVADIGQTGTTPTRSNVTNNDASIGRALGREGGIATPGSVFRAATGARHFAEAAQRRADDRGFGGIDVEGLAVAGTIAANRSASNDSGEASSIAPSGAARAFRVASTSDGSAGEPVTGAAQRLARRHPASTRPGHLGRRGLATAPRDRPLEALDDTWPPEAGEALSPASRDARSRTVPGVIGRRSLPTTAGAQSRSFGAGLATSVPVGAMGLGGLRGANAASNALASPLAVSARASVGSAAAQRIVLRRGESDVANTRSAGGSRSAGLRASASSAGPAAPHDGSVPPGPASAPAQRRSRRAGDAGRVLRAAHIRAAHGGSGPSAAGGQGNSEGHVFPPHIARAPIPGIDLGGATVAGSVGVASMRAVQRLVRRDAMGVAERWEAGGATEGLLRRSNLQAPPRPGQSGRRALPRLTGARTVNVESGMENGAPVHPQGEAAVAAALAQAQSPVAPAGRSEAASQAEGAAQRTARRGSSRARRAAARAAAQSTSSVAPTTTPAQRRTADTPVEASPTRVERSATSRQGERGRLEAASLALPRAIAPQRTVSGLTPRMTPATTSAPGRTATSLAGRETQEAVTAVSALAAIRGRSGVGGAQAGDGARGGSPGSLSAADAIQRIRHGRGHDQPGGVSASATSDLERPGGPGAARILGPRGGQAGEVAGLPVGGPGATVAAARTVAADIVQRALSSISFDSRGAPDAPARASGATGGSPSSGGGTSPSGGPASAHPGSETLAANVGPAPAQRIVSEQSAGAGDLAERGLSEQQIAAIMQALEDRVLAMIERRGGRYRGTF